MSFCLKRSLKCCIKYDYFNGSITTIESRRIMSINVASGSYGCVAIMHLLTYLTTSWNAINMRLLHKSIKGRINRSRSVIVDSGSLGHIEIIYFLTYQADLWMLYTRKPSTVFKAKSSESLGSVTIMFILTYSASSRKLYKKSTTEITVLNAWREELFPSLKAVLDLRLLHLCFVCLTRLFHEVFYKMRLFQWKY